MRVLMKLLVPHEKVLFIRTRTCADGVDVNVEGGGAGDAVTNHRPARVAALVTVPPALCHVWQTG